ncbi:hypothetical protein LTR66_016344, partial [Elasticomyces elasticus]
MMVEVKASSTSSHPEDMDITQQLAALQKLHDQVQHLRTILPNSLLGPARAALLSSRSSNHAAAPSVVASKISKAAVRGHEDIQRFKKQWNAERTKKLFAEVAAKPVGQGNDAWTEHHESLIQQQSKAKQEGLYDGTDELESLEDARKTVVEVETNRPLKMKKPDDPKEVFPIKLSVVTLDFEISRDQERNQYKVKLPADKQSKLDKQVLEAL